MFPENLKIDGLLFDKVRETKMCAWYRSFDVGLNKSVTVRKSIIDDLAHEGGVSFEYIGALEAEDLDDIILDLYSWCHIIFSKWSYIEIKSTLNKIIESCSDDNIGNFLYLASALVTKEDFIGFAEKARSRAGNDQITLRMIDDAEIAARNVSRP